MQYVLTIIITRAHLMQETIRVCNPDTVSMFKVEGDTDYAIQTSHAWYPSLTMSNLLQQLASQYKFQLEIRSYVPETIKNHTLFENWQRILRIPGRLRRMMARWTADLGVLNLGDTNNTYTDDRNSLLIVGGNFNEWRAITSLRRDDTQ